MFFTVVTMESSFSLEHLVDFLNLRRFQARSTAFQLPYTDDAYSITNLKAYMQHLMDYFQNSLQNLVSKSK